MTNSFLSFEGVASQIYGAALYYLNHSLLELGRGLRVYQLRAVARKVYNFCSREAARRESDEFIRRTDAPDEPA